MSNIPRLETARTIMRAFRDEDIDAHAAMAADPEVMRFVGGVEDRATAWRSMALHVGHWQLRGYGTWAVERERDQAMIGRIGLWNPEGWFGLEVGWTLARAAWNQGYATECAGAAMDWAWHELAVDRLISVINRDNDRSVAVARRLGMELLREDRHDGTPVVIYSISRPR